MRIDEDEDEGEGEGEDEENVSVGMVIPCVLYFHSHSCCLTAPLPQAVTVTLRKVWNAVLPQCGFCFRLLTSQMLRSSLKEQSSPDFGVKWPPWHKFPGDEAILISASFLDQAPWPHLTSFSTSLFVGLCCSSGMNLVLPCGDRILFHKCQASKSWNLAF